MVADVIKDQSRTVMLAHGSKQIGKLAKVFAEMEHEAAAVLRAEGFTRSKQRHERSLSTRYRRQSFELEFTERTADLAASFHRAHRERYGYAQEDNEIEIVSAWLRSLGLVPKLPVTKIPVSRGTAKPHGSTITYFGGRKQNVNIYRRDELRGGVKLKTPCIVTEYSATTLIPAGARARIDTHGNILIELL